MRHLFLLPLLWLAACDAGNGPMPLDAQKFLSGLEGPKVPSVQDALVDSAKAAEAQGDFGQAAMYYQQALEKHPGDKDLMLALADCNRRGGDNDRALALYDEVLKADSGNLGAKEGKGLALMAKGDFDTPATLFDEVEKADGTRWKTLNALGILFTTRNMQPEAQKYFDAALKHHPDSPTILNNKGLSQALAHQYDDAIATLSHASALAAAGSQDRKRVDLNTALVYAIAGKIEAARGIAENYYSGAALDNNMGLYAHLAHDDQEARAYLNMALTESKTFYERAWNNLQTMDATGAGNSDSGKNAHGAGKHSGAKAVTQKVPADEDASSSNSSNSSSPRNDDIYNIVNGTGKGK